MILFKVPHAFSPYTSSPVASSTKSNTGKLLLYKGLFTRYDFVAYHRPTTRIVRVKSKLQLA